MLLSAPSTCPQQPRGADLQASEATGEFFIAFVPKKVVLESLFFNDGLFAAIVAAFTTYGVINVPCAAVGAVCECGSYCMVV